MWIKCIQTNKTIPKQKQKKKKTKNKKTQDGSLSLRWLWLYLYSWASLVAQLVRNLPAMQETWVRSLGWEYPLEKGTATYSSVWPGELVHGAAKSPTRLSDSHFISLKKGEIASDQWSDALTWISILQA